MKNFLAIMEVTGLKKKRTLFFILIGHAKWDSLGLSYLWIYKSWEVR